MQYSRDEAREYVRRYLPITNYLDRARKSGYVCPVCGSGTKTHGTGMKYYKETNTCSCFPCGANEPGKKAKVFDVLDAIQYRYGTDYNGALDIACRDAGIEIGHGSRPESAGASKPVPKAMEPAPVKRETRAPEAGAKPQPVTPAPDILPADYTEYYRECAARLSDPAAVAYLEGRGLSLEACRKWNIGFDPAADPANYPGAPADARKKYPAPRIIIPTSSTHYVARSIDPASRFRVINSAGGQASVAGADSLFNGRNDVVFVCEGWADAVSVTQAESAAVSLNSTSNVGMLLSIIEEHGGTDATLILCMDNDDPGRRAESELRDGLRRLGVSFIAPNIAGNEHDLNDALRADKEKFYAAVKEAERMESKKPDGVADYIAQHMGTDIARFQGEIKTGFDTFDSMAGGGLYPGLYTFGAISSLGKTTLIHQMADQMAAGGTDVLFFSLEQSRLELVSKSIARIAALHNIETNVTSLSIRRGYMTQEVRDAAKEYAESVGNHLSIIASDFDITVSDIADYTRQFIRRNNTRPVVIVDYLQIIQAEPDKGGRVPPLRESIDLTVKGLKRLSRELSIAIITISSFNRSNYMLPVDFESFKESGGIEYTADAVFGLQLQCLNDDIFDKKEGVKQKRERIRAAKAEDPRRIELVCLKNRYGKPSFSVYFEYYPRHDLLMLRQPTPENKKKGR